ncbi:MAG: histidine phosphatase family protein [Nitrospiria bacterium]
MKTGHIFIVRHGQTAWNKKRYQGWGDPPLDQTGEAQAEALWEALKDAPVEKVFSSPSIRAIASVRPLLTRRGLPLFLSEDLKELNYGLFEGKLKADHPLKVKRDNLHLPVTGGESLHDLYQRALCFTEDIGPDLAEGTSLIIVGHYWSNRIVLGAIQNHSFDDVITEPNYRPRNASIFEVQYTPQANGTIKVLSAKPRPGETCETNPL